MELTVSLICLRGRMSDNGPAATVDELASGRAQ
ncbi:hypothetical protein MYSI104531_02860 [Mycobacterium simiae]